MINVIKEAYKGLRCRRQGRPDGAAETSLERWLLSHCLGTEPVLGRNVVFFFLATTSFPTLQSPGLILFLPLLPSA